MPLQVAIVPVTPFQQNCSIIMCEETKQAAVVDPGGEVERIMAQAEAMGATLTKILLTHAHLDHVGGTIELAQLKNIKIEGPHIGDKFWLNMLPQQSQMFGFPPAQSFLPDRWLEEGETVTIGNVTLDVIHTPGHTPGHVIFHSKDDQLALVGDVIFQGSIGRTDFPQGNHTELVASIRNKLFPLGDDITFVPGHGPNSTFGHEKRTNPFVSGKAG
jgi:hydroxyacylglutathione hydrolase